MANEQQVVLMKSESNSLGLAGFILSLIGFFSCGLLSPIGLILSFFGLFKPPRGLAIAGFILGLIGSILLLVMLVFGLFAVVLSAAGLEQAATRSSGY